MHHRRAALALLPALLLPAVATTAPALAASSGEVAQKRARVATVAPALPSTGSSEDLAALSDALGGGRAPVRASLAGVAPVTIPTLTSPAPDQVAGGAVVLTATSTAPGVRFEVNGLDVSGAVAVADGTATTTWQSWGAIPGGYVVRASDCDADGCGPSSPDTAFVLQQVDPDVTAPVSGANVSGAVGVTAQVSDGAPLATLWVDGQPQGDPVAVSGGAVTLTWLSAGVANGAHQVGVAACGSAGHCAAPSQVPVTVANAAPVLVAPAANALVSGSTTLSATGPAGGKLFRRNGVDIGFDATAPYAVVANFSAVADADYSLTVQSCGAVRTTCGGLVSAPRTVRTRSLHPTVAVAPAQFSPNGDGRLDTTVVRYALDVPSGVVWTVTDGAGRVVRGPSSLGQRAAGSYAFVWNGRGNGNVALASGLYTLTLRTGRVVTGITLQGSARAGLRLDTVAPTMVVTPQAGGVYPYVDGFRDHLRARVVLNEPATLTLVVRNAAGAVVRVISAPRNAGATYLSWGGTDSLGRAVPGGTYRYAYIAQDALGNRRGTAFFSTGLSRARLVKTVQSRVVTAQASVTGSLVGSCSQVYKSDDYPTQGYDLLSRYDDDSCAYDGSSEDVAATKHAFTLPAAVSYGPIRVAVTGGETLPGYGYDDTAVALYADRNGEPTDIGALLPAAAGTTALPNVTSAYLSGGRTLRWYVVTGDGQWWTPRTFTVTWVAYVLKA